MDNEVIEIRETADRLHNISRDILLNLHEASRLIRRLDKGNDIWRDSLTTWMASIESAISHESLSDGCPYFKMSDAVEALRELADEVEAGVYEGGYFYGNLLPTEV